MPILAVIGIDLEGKREILGFTTGDRENQQAWEDLLENLKERGVATIDLWITDGGKAMINAIQNKFPTAKRQRCVRHKMENVLGYIPNQQHDQVYPELRAIFYQRTRKGRANRRCISCQVWEHLSNCHRLFATRPGHQPDLLSISRNTLEVYSNFQRNRTALSRSQKAQPQNGRCIPQ